MATSIEPATATEGTTEIKPIAKPQLPEGRIAKDENTLYPYNVGEPRTTLHALVSATEFLAAVKATSNAVPPRSTLPVLSMLLLEAADDVVSLIGTDLDMAARVPIKAVVSTPGALCVPTKALLTILDGMTGNVTLVMTEQDYVDTESVTLVDETGAPARYLPHAMAEVARTRQTFEIVAGRSTTTLDGLPRDEFPMSPVLKDGGPSFTLAAASLDAVLSGPARLVSSEESRPILNGMLLEIGRTLCNNSQADHVTFVGTNGHRLGALGVKAPGAPACSDKQRYADAESDRVVDFIVPTGALELARKVFGKKADVRFIFPGKYVEPKVKGKKVEESETPVSANFFQIEGPNGAVITSRLIEGPYPTYRQVIPKDDRGAFTFATKAVLPVLKKFVKLAKAANDQTNRIRLRVLETELKLSAKFEGLCNASDSLPIALRAKSELIEFGVNSEYLLEIASLFDVDELTLAYSKPERALMVTSEERPELKVLLMPLRLLD